MSTKLLTSSSIRLPDFLCCPNLSLSHTHPHHSARRRPRHSSYRCTAIAVDDFVEFPSLTDWKSPLPVQDGLPPVVALGKFDAMHIGHRSLAEAAAAMGGYPWLISFKGMAEVLNWEPQLPVLPLSERGFVLESWAPFCKGHIPRMRYLPFSEIRSMSPEEFVEILAKQLGAVGVVTGTNYRFGYKAAGNAQLLVQLGLEHNIRVHTLDLVAANKHSFSETVSTSQVRESLADGDLIRVNNYLGRRHKLLVEAPAGQLSRFSFGGNVYFHTNTFLNQPPSAGKYSVRLEVLASFLNGPWVTVFNKPLETSVTIGSRGIEIPRFPLQEDEGTRIRLKIEFQ